MHRPFICYKNVDRTQKFLSFCHTSRVWQTDGRTDRQLLIARPQMHSCSALKTCKFRLNSTWKNPLRNVCHRRRFMFVEQAVTAGTFRRQTSSLTRDSPTGRFADKTIRCVTRHFADNSSDECSCRRCCDLVILSANRLGSELIVSELVCQRNVQETYWRLE